MGNTEVRTLTLGGVTAAVPVREMAEQPRIQNMQPGVAELAGALFDCFGRSEIWTPDLFHDQGGPTILQAIRLFCQMVNYELSEAGEQLLDVLELEQLVANQAIGLSSPLQLLCRWTVLVRIGVRKMQRDMLGIVAMLPMPPGGSVKWNKSADHLGRTHYVVTHLFGERFLCRGYAMTCQPDGEWVLGGPTGNRWLKDLYLTPGLQPIDTLVAAKRRKLGGSQQRGRSVDDICNNHKRRLTEGRRAAGIDAKNFGEAHGARLDLENKDIMDAALATVRALLSQVIVYREDAILDDIVGRTGHSKAEVQEDPTLAGSEEDAFKLHTRRRDDAYGYFRPCGRFEIPKGYMVFAETGIPPALKDIEHIPLSGVTGAAISMEHLSGRKDLAPLRRAPTALPDVEDLAPLIDACGIPTINRQVVVEMEPLANETGQDIMRYRLGGDENTAEMLLSEFVRRTAVRFVPMVLDFRRRRLFVEDLQGVRHGIAWEISYDDVNKRFTSCPRPKRSETSPT